MQHLIEPKHQLKPLYSVQLANRFIRGLEQACYGGSLHLHAKPAAPKNDHKLALKGENVRGTSSTSPLLSNRGDGGGGRASLLICIVIESGSHFPYQGLSPCLILNHQHQRKVITRVNYLFSIWLFTLLFFSLFFASRGRKHQAACKCILRPCPFTKWSRRNHPFKPVDLLTLDSPVWKGFNSFFLFLEVSVTPSSPPEPLQALMEFPQKDGMKWKEVFGPHICIYGKYGMIKRFSVQRTHAAPRRKTSVESWA